jgi:hypothetical protein
MKFPLLLQAVQINSRLSSIHAPIEIGWKVYSTFLCSYHGRIRIRMNYKEMTNHIFAYSPA